MINKENEVTLSAVIVSWGRDEAFKTMTQNAIDTAIASGVEEVVVLEMENIVYANALTIRNVGEFNYNRSLNRGIEQCKGKYIALCNNDLHFHEGFGSIAEEMKSLNIHSASPCEGDGVPTKGYRIGLEMRGWCIVLDRYCLLKIGKLDETYNFHYSDNAYADQLIGSGIDHYLLYGYKVEHLTSKTLETLPSGMRVKYTRRQKKLYNANKGRSIHLPNGATEQPSVTTIPTRIGQRAAQRRNRRRRPPRVGR